MHKGEALFPRIDVKKEMEALTGPAQESAPQPVKEEKKPQKAEKVKNDAHDAEITYDDFKKLELRLAKVLTCVPAEGSDKLYVLKIRIGEEERQIVSSIRAYYTPEEMVGKTIVVVVNLKPAKIRGIESFGMLLAVDDGKGGLALATTDRSAPDGQRVN